MPVKNLFSLNKQCLELNGEEKEKFFFFRKNFIWKELVVILKGMESCWTITIDLLFFFNN